MKKNLFQDSVINFNSLYVITINEEFLNYEGYSSGECDMLDLAYRPYISNLSDPNQCAGILRYCWFKSVSCLKYFLKMNFRRIIK